MNQNEFIQVVTPFKDKLFRLAKRMLVSREEAEDAIQEVMVRLWNKNSDLERYNSQYEPITIKPFSQSHDRFLILDRTELYHIGASLKDLGKKWFAFSKMDLSTSKILEQLEEQ